MKKSIGACSILFLTLFLTGGCSSTVETYAENRAAESADVIPPADSLLQLQPEILFREEPYYPEMAQKSGTEGAVVLRGWITKTGVVRKLFIHKSEAEMFNQSALTAGLKYRFGPMVIDGIAKDSWVEFTIQYRMNK